MKDYQAMAELEQPGLDNEALLASLSLELITDNMMQQIQGTVVSNTDFLSIVLSKFNIILSSEGILDDDRTEIKFQMIDFCDNLINIIADAFNLMVNVISDDYVSHIQVLQTLYNVLVLNQYDSVETFLVTYISANKNPIIDSLGIRETGKDITTMSVKKKNISEENIAILAHVNEIIEFIRHVDAVEPEEFITTINDGSEDITTLYDFYMDGTVAGNFVTPLMNYVLGDEYDSDSLSKIRNTIRIIFSE